MAVGMPATQDEMAGGEMPNSGAEIMNETRAEWEENPPTTDEPATGNIYSQPVHNRACSRPQPQEDEQARHQENQAQGLPTLNHNLVGFPGCMGTLSAAVGVFEVLEGELLCQND